MPGFHGFSHAKISLVDNTGVVKVIRVAAQPKLKLFELCLFAVRLTIFSVLQVKVGRKVQVFS